MLNQDKLLHLESTHTALKEQYSNKSVYSDTQVQLLQREARLRHVNTEEFVIGAGLYALPKFLEQKYSEGFSYVEAPENAYVFPMSSTVFLRLQKPSDILDSEYAALDLSVKEKYTADVEAFKVSLIEEITSIQLQIKDTQKAISDEEKQKTAYSRELAKVQKELLGSAAVTEQDSV